MGRFKVVVTDQVFPSVDIERDVLGGIGADLMVADGTLDGVISAAVDADGLLNTYFPIDADLIGQLTRCRVIARYGIGVDNIDLAAAQRKDITVTNVPDYSVEEVAAHALALILTLIRRLPLADEIVRHGSWGIQGLRPIGRISELTFGLIGYGRIARRLSASLVALGARQLVYDPYLPPVSLGGERIKMATLEEVVSRSDVVSIHAPLTPETRGLFDASRIAAMPRGAILVNTSRGPLVVYAALLDALRSGHLGGAGLDVFDREPPDPTLVVDVPNLVLTPHMAYYSEESLQESQRKAATQVVKVLSGADPDYPVRVA